MDQSFERILLLFFTYAVIGWLWETVYCSIKAKKFVYRGFLVGPYCPIYGFGVLAVLYFIEPYQNNLLFLYVFSAVTVTILEYITSYVLEKLFHTTWWDYKDVPLNLNGRIALPVSLFWGIGCVFIVKVIQPLVSQMVDDLISHFGLVLPLLIIVIMLADLCYSVVSMAGFRQKLTSLAEEVEERRTEALDKMTETRELVGHELEQFKANRENWLNQVKQSTELKAHFDKLNFNQKRMLRSFSNLNVPSIKNFKDLKEVQKKVKR
ncbi:putative ABC transporter permease [Carnobacterium gallinarum]|uniref:putative ABC transporter permease n=1 Tax=Carnobacterium gallinarum TaxID=2749 RepID=UPI0005529E8C|nr:membrane protein [Carnobacterium gallinarum]